MLRRVLKKRNCPTCQAKGDADVIIETTAVESAQERITVLIGNHTDVLVIDGIDVSSTSNRNHLNSRSPGLEYEDS